MPIDYLPILVMVVVVVAFAAIALTISSLTGPRHPTPAKLEPYESGMPPFGSARRRISITQGGLFAPLRGARNDGEFISNRALR